MVRFSKCSEQHPRLARKKWLGRESKMAKKHQVLIGKKDMTKYVMACLSMFNQEGAEEIVIKARGRLISRAVDVAEYLRNKVMKDVQVKEVRIGTEALPGDDGGGNVSTIEIVIARTK